MSGDEEYQAHQSESNQNDGENGQGNGGGGGEEASDAGDLKNRKLFLGGLNYSTTEEGLKDHFGKYGELVDVVVIRFPDSKRSRGFGFITYETQAQAEACYDALPHVIDGNDVELKWATPRDQMEKENKGKEQSETGRKVFVGGLNYSTTSDGLREYFGKFGEIVDSVVLRFPDTKRSRGFGFVTYASTDMVDACQAARPHTIDGSKVETKRATPKEEGDSSTVKKAFIGALKDAHTDEDLKEYFSQFGEVVKVEQMVDKSTGRKRGFGFVEFNDYDPVDKLILKGEHIVNDMKIDVKKALSKDAMDRGGGNRRSGGRFDDRGRGGAPSPWGNGRDGFGGGFGGPWNSGPPTNQFSPWQSDFSYGGGPPAPMANAWEDQSGWGGSGGGYGSGYGATVGGGFGVGAGGPMRNSMSGNRPAPYPVGGRGGGSGGGGFGNRGGGGFGGRSGGGGGFGGRGGGGFNRGRRY